jgi:hypothetical protein
MKSVADLIPDQTHPNTIAAEILAYLKERIPSYPFKPKIDNDFVDELVHDFGYLEILDEIKAFRWYYDNDPVAKVSNVRLSLRRWLRNARDRTRY